MKCLPAVALALWLGAASETGSLEGPLTWDGLGAADGASALVFETDGRKVVAIRAGRVPAAEYLEGCS